MRAQETPHCLRQRAIIGLATGLAFSMWVGFGVPRPDAVRLPTRRDGCDFNITATPPPPTQDSSEYFYLHCVSYLWVVVLGFLLTLIVGGGCRLRGGPQHAAARPRPLRAASPVGTAREERAQGADLWVPSLRHSSLPYRGCNNLVYLFSSFVKKEKIINTQLLLRKKVGATSIALTTSVKVLNGGDLDYQPKKYKSNDNL
ncbi:uncharacterized protein LOC126426648 [Schistocerca serialis cubense]|uniref:uncharacterized protein LOC126426648 n=1 Tax=Schistocerca serialis cubense TaxID=2023355 RepID=UPI00214E3AB6|nr:uncharacterized protein LOC126426648 [Schistocerca serialis cubense]